MINMIYLALRMHAHTEKTTFSFKDDKCKALTYDIGPGDKTPQIFCAKGAVIERLFTRKAMNSI